MIQVENFTAAYDGQVVLRGVNFDVYRGEVFAILGGSGCGKSTLLKHMIGLYKPAAGRILIDGQDIVAADGEARWTVEWTAPSASSRATSPPPPLGRYFMRSL